MSLNVAIIDQDLDDRAIIQEVLMGLGCEVKLGITSSDAMDLFKEEKFDLIICNNLMPTLNEGIDLVKNIRKVYGQDIYIVINSYIKELKIIKEFLDLKASDYLIKPLDLDILISKVSFKFDEISKKNFASIGIKENEKDNLCVIELGADLISISEEFVEVSFEKEKVELNSKLYIEGKLFRGMGIDKDSIELEIVSTENGKYKCNYVNLSDIELALVRRWVLENYLLS